MSRRDRKPPYVRDSNGTWHFAPGPAMRTAGVKGRVLGKAGSREAKTAYDRALAHADRKLREHRDAEELAPARGVTVGMIMDDWSSDANMKGRKKRSPKTIAGYRQHTRQLAPIFGDLDASTLTVNAVEEWFWPAFDVHAHQTHALYRSLRAAMNYGVKRGMIEAHRIHGCDFPLPNTRDRLVEREELRALMKAALDLGYRGVAVYCAMAVTCGQRPGDILAMEAERIAGGSMTVVQGKTGATVTVPLHPYAANVIGQDGGAWLVARPDNGERYSLRLFNDHWRRVRAAAAKAMPSCADIWAYDLRTACVVYMAQGGATIAQIASVTGHKLATVTKILEHYLPRNAVLAMQAVATIDPENAPVVDLFRDRA